MDMLAEMFSKKKLAKMENELAIVAVRYIQNKIKRGDAGLKPISAATRKLTGNHPPLSNTGDLLNHLEAKDGTIGFSNNTLPDSNISYANLAAILQSGFRVPLTGAKGEKVRNWLHYNGIHCKKSTKYIVVPPRPFLDKLVEEFMDSTEYDEIVNRVVYT